MINKKLHKLAKTLEKQFKNNEPDFKFLLKYRIKSNQNENKNILTQEDNQHLGEDEKQN